MRTPLSCFNAGIRILQDPTSAEEEKGKALKTMQSCSDRLARMAEELSTYRGADYVSVKAIELGPTIKSCCHQMRVAAEPQGVLLTYDCDLPKPIWVDNEKLWRVIENLLQNAIHAVVEHRKTNPAMIACLVNLKAEMSGDTAVICITDTGHGLQDEHLDQVFKEGFTTKGRNGTGLGLIFCGAVIEALGGTITARNLPTGGAEFRIELPVA